MFLVVGPAFDTYAPRSLRCLPVGRWLLRPVLGDHFACMGDYGGSRVWVGWLWSAPRLPGTAARGREVALSRS